MARSTARPWTTLLDCLALNVYWEARAEPRLGQIAVAEVTLNRVADPAFPDTVCAVVRQGEDRGLNLCQFSWYCDGLDDQPRDPSAWHHARRLALLALSGRLPDPTEGALWFHSDQVHPDWPELAPTVKIGSHIFYRTAPVEARTTAQLQEPPPLPPAAKPAPPVRKMAAEVVPAVAPPGPGASADPVAAIDHAGDCDQGLAQALAGASEADFLALVDRMRRHGAQEAAAGRVTCAGDTPGDQQAIVLAPASTPVPTVHADRSSGAFAPTLLDRADAPLAELDGLAASLSAPSRPAGAPIAVDLAPATSF